MDLLPTATLEAKPQWKQVKLDTGAQYCVAGETWKSFGARLNVPAPVDYMEGFSGVAVGVRRLMVHVQDIVPTSHEPGRAHRRA